MDVFVETFEHEQKTELQQWTEARSYFIDFSGFIVIGQQQQLPVCAYFPIEKC